MKTFEKVATAAMLTHLPVLYHPPIFHMESIWNGYIPWIPCGFHVEYVYSIWIKHLPHDHSIWIPYSFHMESMLTPYGIHDHSMWNHSTWNDHGFHME